MMVMTMTKIDTDDDEEPKEEVKKPCGDDQPVTRPCVLVQVDPVLVSEVMPRLDELKLYGNRFVGNVPFK
jgi:hypothetical protein